MVYCCWKVWHLKWWNFDENLHCLLFFNVVVRQNSNLEPIIVKTMLSHKPCDDTTITTFILKYMWVSVWETCIKTWLREMMKWRWRGGRRTHGCRSLRPPKSSGSPGSPWSLRSSRSWKAVNHMDVAFLMVMVMVMIAKTKKVMVVIRTGGTWNTWT